MRVRKRKGVAEYLSAHGELVLTEKRNWKEIFQNEHPVQIEVGSGKGDFIIGMAKRHPEINFIAVEIQESVISHILDKLLEAPLSNVRLLWIDGANLTDYFESSAVDLLYLNFSDPWPKKRHEKRRLTSKAFLSTYQKILKPEGQIHFKTDNRQLFEYSLSSMSLYGMVLEKVWLDLHTDKEFAEENVWTEYERKFSKKGQVIYQVFANYQLLKE